MSLTSNLQTQYAKYMDIFFGGGGCVVIIVIDETKSLEAMVAI